MRDFYLGDPRAAEYYDLQWASTAGTAIDGDVEFYAECARACGDPVLELGCGTGRVALELARAGFRVVGIDLSPAMLARAQARREALPAAAAGRLRLATGDMSDLHLDEMFPLAIVPFRAFQHLLTPEDQRRCLRSIRAHLVPGGRLVLHLFDPKLEWCHDGPQPRTGRPDDFPLPDGGRLNVQVEQRTNDAAAQRFQEVWRWREFAPDGSLRNECVETLALRWTYQFEMQHLLELERLQVEALHGDFRAGPFRHGGEQIWVARRR